MSDLLTEDIELLQRMSNRKHSTHHAFCDCRFNGIAERLRALSDVAEKAQRLVDSVRLPDCPCDSRGYELERALFQFTADKAEAGQ